MSGLFCGKCPAKDYNICRPLEHERQRELFARTTPMHWARRQSVFRFGDPVRFVHKITSGMVMVSKPMPDGKRQVVDFPMTGDICGFLQSGGKHAFDCEAVVETRTCTVDSASLARFVARHRDVAAALEDTMMQRHDRVTQHMAALGQISSTGKLAYFLTWLGKMYSERGEKAQPLTLPMTRVDIADFLGVRLETVSRSLKELKDRQLIDMLATEAITINPSLLTTLSRESYLN